MTLEKNNNNDVTNDIPYEDIKFVQTTDSSIIQEKDKILKLIIEKLAKKIKSNNGIAKALIFGNLHTGGTAAKTSPTHFFSFTASGKEHYLDLKTLRTIIENVTQETNTKFTTRQLARSFETEILEFAQKLNLPGNLAKKLSIIYTQIEKPDLIYCSDYVNPINPIIPQYLSDILKNHKNSTN